jgi:type VII secretion-associated serine protease mycosin
VAAPLLALLGVMPIPAPPTGTEAVSAPAHVEASPASAPALAPAADVAQEPMAPPVTPETPETPPPLPAAPPPPAPAPATGVAHPTNSTGPAWTALLTAHPRPTRTAVLERAPVFGPVRLVTVRNENGRPVAGTITVADRRQAAGVVDRALADPGMLALSTAGVVRIEAADPFRSQQWALDRLAAEQVWKTQPGRGVVIAVVDTGVDAGHPDLAGVVLPGTEIGVGTGNGQRDPNGHGTHVAGVIAAVADNGIGGAGLAQGVRILPVRVLGGTGTGSDADVANGIVWAADRGASVINLSVGATEYSPAEAAAVAYATQKGAVVVSASGNFRGKGNPVTYPAAFPNVIGVGATDADDRVAKFSSTGSYVDLVAPGVEIVSTYKRAYSQISGTSAACPMVAATAALIRAAAPALNPAQVAAVLQGTARDVESRGADLLSGAGLVQPLAAITRAQSIARGAAVAPGPAPSRLPASALSVVSAPSRGTFRSTVKVTFRLTVRGAPLAKVAVSICRTTAPSTKAVCTAAVTDSAGRATAAIVIGGHLTVWAKYAGTARVAPSNSRPVLISALPQTRLSAGTRSLTLSLTPTAPRQRVGVQRRDGRSWSTVSSPAVPTTGRLTVTGLSRDAVYRMSVPATDRTLSAMTSAVAVR